MPPCYEILQNGALKFLNAMVHIVNGGWVGVLGALLHLYCEKAYNYIYKTSHLQNLT